jgi:hypothetical protein
MKGVRRFGIKVKLAPHYIGLYPILEKYGPLAYQVELPSRLSGVLNVLVPRGIVVIQPFAWAYI